MTRNRSVWLGVALTSAVIVATQPVAAKRFQGGGTMVRPGLGVSGIGVPTPYIPAPGVATPTVNSNNVTTPMVTSNPGVPSRNTNTNAVIANPGATAQHVETQGVASQPGVATNAPAVSTLPHGYYTSIPPDAVQVMHKGEMVFSSRGAFYRPEYYMGNVVYVVVK